MQGKDVVDVDEVFVDQLPVAVERGFKAPVDPELALLKNAELLRKLGNEVFQRCRIGVEIDKNPALSDTAANRP